jgi:hypothetical protein
MSNATTDFTFTVGSLQTKSIFEIVGEYNSLLQQGYGLGLDKFRHKPVRSFPNKLVALAKFNTLYSLVVAAHEVQQNMDALVGSLPVFTATRAKEEDIIELLHTGDNPKKKKSAERFALYQNGMSVKDYIDKVGDRQQAMNDIRWDTRKGWIRIKKD